MAAPLPTVMGSSCGHLASHFNCVSHRNAGEGGARVISERCNVYFVFFVKMMNLRLHFWQLFSNYRNGGR